MRRFLVAGLNLLFIAIAYGEWSPGFDLFSENLLRTASRSVYTLAVTDGGELFAAGLFERRGPGLDRISSRNIARWSGTNWNTVGMGVNGPINQLLAVGNDVYAGGTFTMAGGKAATNIARWDGTNWWPLGSGLSGRFVQTLLWKDGSLFAGGAFTNEVAPAIRNVAVWDGTNWLDVGGGIGSSSTAEVTALVAQGSNLIAGGFFTSAGGTYATNIARFDGTRWQPVGPGVPFRVFAMTTNPAGQLFAAGGTYSFGPSFVSEWDGGTWRVLYAGSNAANRAARLVFWHDGHLYTDAAHMYGGPGPLRDFHGGLARLDETGWTQIDAPFYPLQAGPAYFKGQLVFAGMSGTPVTLGIPYVALWNTKEWEAVGAGVMGRIETLAFQNDDLLAAGHFESYMAGSEGTKFLVQWNGKRWLEIGDAFRGNLALSFQSQLRALATRGDTIITVLPFTGSVVQIERTNMTRLGEDLPGAVATVAFVGTNLYAGGAFGIRAWTGNEWKQLAGGIDGTALAITGTGESVYVGGSFSHAGGVEARNIAFWNGNTWFSLGEGVDSNVWCIALSPFGMVAGGEFAVAGPVQAKGVAVWNGSSWAPLAGGVVLNSGAPGTVRALAINSSGDIYVGGNFARAGEIPATNIALWQRGVWRALDEGVSGNFVNTLFLKGEKLYVGGDFFRAGNVPSFSLAVWSEPVNSHELVIELLGKDVRVRVHPSALQYFIQSNLELGSAARWETASSNAVVTITNITQREVRFFRGMF